MTGSLKDIAAPAAPASILSADQALQGPWIPPQQRILFYSSAEWEGFIQEWVHFCLKSAYSKVQRFTGAGDRGVDIAGFADSKFLQGVWDNYQCKHYDHALYPSDAWPEIGKILWHSFNKDYAPPRAYFFVAPKGVGTELTSLLGNADRLKKGLIDNWEKNCAKKITATQEILLDGDFKAYVEAFDFGIFGFSTSLEIIEAHKQKCPYHAARFGGGLPPRPTPASPPADNFEPHESRYVEQLFEAYGDHIKNPVSCIDDLKSQPKLKDHFARQRVAFYHAESLRIFAREAVPPGTYEALQNEIHAGVIDDHDSSHPDGYSRVCAVTKSARELQLTANALVPRVQIQDRDGICHQLANDDRLKWTTS